MSFVAKYRPCYCTERHIMYNQRQGIKFAKAIFFLPYKDKIISNTQVRVRIRVRVIERIRSFIKIIT